VARRGQQIPGRRCQGRADFRRRLAVAADDIADAKLRQKVRDLLPVVEKSAALSARIRKILKDVSAYGGSGKTEPGGPDWLRKLGATSPCRSSPGSPN
jgi:hypothetical protein